MLNISLSMSVLSATCQPSLTFAEAAALQLTTLTAWEMSFDRLQIPVLDDAAVTDINADKPLYWL